MTLQGVGVGIMSHIREAAFSSPKGGTLMMKYPDARASTVLECESYSLFNAASEFLVINPDRINSSSFGE